MALYSYAGFTGPLPSIASNFPIFPMSSTRWMGKQGWLAAPWPDAGAAVSATGVSPPSKRTWPAGCMCSRSCSSRWRWRCSCCRAMSSGDGAASAAAGMRSSRGNKDRWRKDSDGTGCFMGGGDGVGQQQQYSKIMAVHQKQPALRFSKCRLLWI